MCSVETREDSEAAAAVQEKKGIVEKKIGLRRYSVYERVFLYMEASGVRVLFMELPSV
jgi:hypothetical protein